MSKEANRIMNNCARIPGWHGTISKQIVNEILESCGGEIMCNGHLREFEFTTITPDMYSFKTVNWYDKHRGGK
jgi:hypothetical protein